MDKFKVWIGSKAGRNIVISVLVALLVIAVLTQLVGGNWGGLTGTAGLPAPSTPAVCLPTCSTVDGRMLSIASVGYVTLAGQTIYIDIAAPSSLATFDIGVFDGNSSGAWDLGASATPLVYTLYADPTRSGDTSIQLAQWMGDSMADNAWTDMVVTQDARAQAPSGAYFYSLQIELPNAATVKTWSNFKIRSNAPVEMASDKSFAYAVPLFTPTDVSTLYPQGAWSLDPNTWTLPTTYDGTWDMYLNVPSSSPWFVIYDGDMDHGSNDCAINDTNDADTPDDGIPSWAEGISDVPEGVASTTNYCRDAQAQIIPGPNGETYATGNPADSHLNPRFGRTESVIYEVVAPNGTVYRNDNPSGNQEWEQFRIDSDANTPADHHVTGFLPAGIYHVRIIGLDISNLNAWHLVSGKAVCVRDDGAPCVPVLYPYLIGDTIWNDANGNGVQDGGEAGIAGVTVTLLDLNGQPIATAATDANGQYSFGVEAGAYTVQVDAGNFNAGGALAGLSSTTGGDSQANTVTNANILTYDFGYRGTASIGDLVWTDVNGNGLQDGGETGLSGVTVNLLGSDGATVIATTTTDSNGNYAFANLPGGTYYVQVMPPAGYAFTTQYASGSTAANDSNVNSSGKSDAITLAAGQAETTVDAGLTQASSTVNYCAFIRSPGFWKNYKNHMSDAIFLNIIQHTQDFSYLTVSQAVKILSKNSGTTKMGIPDLDGTNASYLKFLLTAELNAAWNGDVNAAGVGGTLGTGYHQDAGLTVNNVLHQAYLDRKSFSMTQFAYLKYLGAGGETDGAGACQVQATP